MSAPITVTRAWLRRARDTGPGLLLALITALTAGFLVLLPTAEDTAYDRAVVDTLADAPAGGRDIRLVFNARSVPSVLGPFAGMPLHLPGTPQTEMTDRVAQIVSPASRSAMGTPDFSATTVEFDVKGPGTSPVGRTRHAMVRVQGGLNERVRWDTGALATTSPGTKTYIRKSTYRGAPEFVQSRTVPVISVAVPTEVARAWKISVGDRFALEPVDGAQYAPMPITLELTGTYMPLDRADPFWGDEARLLRPDVQVEWDLALTSRAAFVVAPELVGQLGQALEASPADLQDTLVGPDVAHGLLYQWRYRVDAAVTDRAGAATLLDGIRAMEVQTSAWGDLRPTIVSGLDDLMAANQGSVTVTRALVAFVSIALLALGTAAAVLLTLVLLDRRAPALVLQSARGARPRQVVAQPVAEVAVWSLVAGALVLALAWLWRGAPLPAAALAAVPVLAALLTAALLARRIARMSLSPSGSRAGDAARILVEIAVLGGAYFAWSTVLSRGRQIGSGQVDWYAALAPVLIAAAVAVLVLRLYPVPLRLLAHRLARGRSILGFLGLTRAARSGGRALVPLVGLVIAATLATFLGSLALSIRTERALAAYELTGADLRIDATRIDPGEVDQVRARAGISAVIPAYVSAGEQVTGQAGSDPETVLLIAADPAAYAAALAGTPLAFSPAAAGGSAPRVTGLASQRLRPTGDLQITVGGNKRDIAIGGVQPGLRRDTATRTQPVVLLPWADLLAVSPSLQPNTLFVMGTPEAVAALAVDPPTGLTDQVLDRRAGAERFADRALPTFIRTLVIAGLALAVTLSVLCVLIVVTLTRQDRVDTLARLRVLGQPRRGLWRLAVLEVLPPAAMAIVVGALVGMLLPSIMQRAIDLAPFAGGPANPPLHASPTVALACVLTLLLLTLLAVLLDVARARRASLSAHLRAGVQR